MNERIKDLIDKCTTTHTEYYDGRGNVTSSYFDKEKFAKLIVTACANKFKSVYTDQQYPIQIDKTLKQMFGIK